MSLPPVVKILTTRTCRWSLRLSVALREKNVPFELVNVMQDGRKAPWFAASTPFGKTPVLEHGGRTLPESLVICEYIDETFGGRPLLPLDPLERAWARVWMRFCDYTLIKGLSDVVRAAEVAQRTQAVAALIDEGRRLETYRVANVTGAHVNTAGVAATAGMGADVDAGTAGGAAPYWHGGELMLPDICYHTFFDALERTGSALQDAFLTACQHLAEWREALLANGAFSMAGRELDALGE
ncbi:MAG TPA: glutathione S-transferase family protein [Steroidobacteraceae bacterium]